MTILRRMNRVGFGLTNMELLLTLQADITRIYSQRLKSRFGDGNCHARHFLQPQIFFLWRHLNQGLRDTTSQHKLKKRIQEPQERPAEHLKRVMYFNIDLNSV